MEDAIAIYRNRSAYGLRGVGLYDYAGSDEAKATSTWMWDRVPLRRASKRG